MKDFPWPLGAVLDHRLVFNSKRGPLTGAVLALLSAHGLSRIQLHLSIDTPFDRRVFLDALDAHGLRCESVHAPFGREDTDISHVDPDVRRHALALQRDILLLAADLGASLVVIHAARKIVPDNQSRERMSHAVEALQRLGALAQEHHLRLAVENLPQGHLPASAEQCLELLDRVAHPAVGLAYDSGHANLVGNDAAGFLEQLGSAVIATHIHDNDGHEDCHIAPGEGGIAWPAVLKALKRNGYDGTFTLEWSGLYYIGAEQRAEALFRRLQSWAADL